MTSNLRTSLPVLAASLLASSALIAGCGSSDSSDNTPPAVTTDAGPDAPTPDSGPDVVDKDTGVDSSDKDVAQPDADAAADAQPDAGPAVTWNETYGAVDEDYLFAVQTTKDGGYVAAGCTDKLDGKAGAWLIKFNKDGSVAWSTTFAGSKSDCAKDVRQTKDGGYILTGYGLAKAGDNQDVLVIKTDSQGKEQWRYLNGTDEDDESYSVVEAPSGSFIVVGDRFQPNTITFDAFALSLDATGKKQWEHDYGAAGHDYFYRVENDPAGGFMAAGNTASKGAGKADMWLVKLDKAGTTVWDKTFGGPDFDYGYTMRPTSDGGWIIAGASYSSSSDIQSDAWVVKTDKDGTKQWDHLYGGEPHEYIRDITEASNGDFVFVGQESLASAGTIDALGMRIDKDGTLVWDERYIGDKVDGLYGVAAADDGGFVMVGYTKSWGAGGEDGWILKTDADGKTEATPKQLP